MSDPAAPTVPPAWFEHLAAVITPELESPFRDELFPVDPTARHSAVLILFGPGTPERGPEILLTERARDLRSHPGQVAFPGGRLDPEDAGPEAAALREAQEEAEVDPAGVEVRALGPDLYLGVTRYRVTPVIAWWRTPSQVRPGDPAEVSRVLSVPIAELTDPANRFQVSRGGFSGPGFEVGGLFVWGFTAMVLTWLIRLAGLERPWDQERHRPIPEHMIPLGLARNLTEQQGISVQGIPSIADHDKSGQIQIPGGREPGAEPVAEHARIQTEDVNERVAE